MPVRPRVKPARLTRQRILEATLALYNEMGEGEVSTNLIAAEVGISAGNLHYHFRRKDQLTQALLEGFVEEVAGSLPPEEWRAEHVEDAWFLLHVLFEIIWKYRFLFRDLSGVMARDRRMASRLRQVFARVIDVSRSICLGLAERGELLASAEDIEALAHNVAVLTLYWLSFETARRPSGADTEKAIVSGVYHVLMMVAPFMGAEGQDSLRYLAAQYSAAPARI